MRPDSQASQSQQRFDLLPFRQGGWRGFIHQEWQDFPGFQDLAEWLSDPKAETVLETHCRTILRQETPRGAVYSKLMKAQNDGVILKNEHFSKFKWRFYPSRAICIVQTTAAMLAAGHHCPLPILGLRRRDCGPMPQDLYIATEIPDPTVEERLLQASDQDEQLKILEICGRELARLHGDGFVHGDFLPRNTCLNQGDSRFSYLDNDRTRRWPNTPIFHFKRRNLTQFCFNLHVLGLNDLPDLTHAFITAYALAAGWPKGRLQREQDTINAQNKIRWDKTMHR